MGPVASSRQSPEYGEGIVEVSQDQWRQTVSDALEELGLTWEQLKQEAHRREFSSRKAHVLWVTSGGVLDR
jgi:hypothetical protein